MKLDDIVPTFDQLNEIWSKGDLPSKHVIQTVKHYLGNKAEVKELPISDQKKTGKVVEIKMYYHEFLSKFGPKGGVDRILTLYNQHKKAVNKLDDAAGRGYFDPYLGRVVQHSTDVTDVKKLLKNVTNLHQKLAKQSLNSARSIVPNGWMLAGINLDMMSISDLLDNSTIKFYIKRDHSARAPEHNGIYYHATFAKNVDSIMRKGLIPGDNKRTGFDGFRNRLFLTPQMPDYEFVEQLMGGGYFGTQRSDSIEVAVFGVTIPDGVNVYVDDEYSDGVFIQQTIPPSNLKLIYSGPLTKIPLNN